MKTKQVKFYWLKTPKLISLEIVEDALTGKLAPYRSINITGDWRALYSEDVDDEGNKTFIFEALGAHSQLYR